MTDGHQFDFIVVGAGIVGLATAYKLIRSYPGASLLVIEKENRVAAHQTGHNSGVIHSGIYYKPGSYKAKNCVDGRHQLVDFCRKHNVEHDICGKVIVATEEEEMGRLEKIYERGVENGIEGIALIDEKEVREIEPYVRCVAGIHVPCAGIVDFKGVCEALANEIRDSGGEIRFNLRVDSVHEYGKELNVVAGGETFKCEKLISCAGLQSDLVAKAAGIRGPVHIVPFRGEYFELTPEAEHKVKGLIYPLPNPEFPFLGVHFTRMACGGVECGPNAVFAFKREGYSKLSFDMGDTIDTFNFPGFWKLAAQHWRMGLDEMYRSLSKEAFLQNLQKLIPSIKKENLTGSPSGVRAMALLPDGSILDDFYFETTEKQVHVLNAPSPAATAALSIGDEIVNKLERTHDGF